MEKSLPSYLSAAAKLWARKVLRDYDIMDSEWDTLLNAAQCLDRIAAAREAIKRDGITVMDRYTVPKQHPALIIENTQTLLFTKLCKCLKLFKEQDPRGVSYRPRQSKKPGSKDVMDKL